MNHPESIDPARVACALALAAALVSAPLEVAGTAASLEPFVQKITGTVAELPMLPVPAGDLDVADPSGPGGRRKVAVAPFWIAATETPWDLYDIFVYALDEPDGGRMPGADATTRPSRPYLPPDRGFGHAGYPAISVSFKGATEFCAWLSRKTGRSYRLPTDVEWEYACRAGTSGAYSFGEEVALLGDHAWFRDNSGLKSHAVGKKKPNAWGLLDAHGNVAEWTSGPEGRPLACGGSFLDPPETLRCDARLPPSPAWNASDPQIPKGTWWLADCSFVGFRVVCVPGTVDKKPSKEAR
jgi:formylglycine-generating enzyme required for sulfatase activity